MKSKSTTEIRNNFRDSVADLLVSSGYSVETEVLIDHKKVDIVATHYHLGEKKTAIIEAKKCSGALNKGDLEKILSSHLSIINKNRAGELIVVSNRPITSPAAKVYLKETREIRHMTLHELLGSIFDFRQFLNHFVDQLEEDGLEKYYISQRTDSDQSIEHWIDQWIEGDEVRPIAIIASYGMGKTSLAKHLCYKLAKAHLKDPAGRIPLLISLGALRVCPETS